MRPFSTKSFSTSKNYRLWLIVCAAIIVAHCSFGQTKEIDSLQAVLKTSTLPIQRITVLNELANIFRLSDDSITLAKYLDEAITLSKQQKYLKGLKYAYSTLGSINFNKANLQEAERYYKLSESLAGQGLETVTIRNNDFYSELYNEQGKFSQALALISSTLQLGEAKDLIKTHCLAATVYQQRSENEKAYYHLQAARAEIKSSKSATLQFQVYKQVISYFRNNTNLDSLTFYTNKQDTVCKKLYFNYWKMQSNHAQAFLNYAKGAYGNAVNFTLRSFDVLNPSLFKYQYTYLLYEAGSFYHELQVHDKARDYMIKAKKLAENTNLRFATLYINNSLAFQFYRTGDLNKAIDFAQKTLLVAKQIDLKEIKSNVYGLLSEIYLAQGNIEKAIVEGDSSIEAAKQADDVIGEANSYQTQVPNYLANNQYDRAIEVANIAIALFTKIGDNLNSIGEQYLNLTEAYIGKNELGMAFHFLTKAAQITKTSEIPSLKLEQAIISVKYYEAKRDYKHALENQKLVVQWNDSINNQASKEHLIKVEMLYDVEKREQQLKILTEQEATQKAYAKLQQNKLERDNLIIAISCCSILILLLVAILLYNNSEKKEKANEELKALNLEITNQNQEITSNLIKINELNSEIEDREKQYRRIVENAEDIICELDENGRFTYTNPAGLKLLEYSLQELKQLEYLNLLDNSFTHTVPATIANHVKNGINTFYVEAPIVTKYGNRHWIGVNVMRHLVSPKSARAEVFARNITERKKAEQYIKSINSRLENLIQTMQAGILVEDQQGQVVLTNEAFCDIFKIPIKPAQLIGLNCKMAAREASQFFEESEVFISEIETIELNRKIVINNELKMLDGKVLWRDYVPIISENKFYGQMWIYRDVSHQKKLEQELKIAKEEAELANEAKSEFLANISHELRTPLNAVIGFSDLLQKSNLDKSQLKFTNIIIESSELLLKIIEDILDFSKIESGRLQLYFEPTNLQSLGENALNVIRPNAQAKGISLIFDFQDFPKQVYVDQTRLQQILINLLSNALKFTETGSVELGMQYKGGSEGKVKILFYVEDTGLGIAPENQAKIFEAFVQEDISTTKKYGGTGLGLTISNNLISLMGGKLELESTLGKGSKFFFTLEIHSERDPSVTWSI